LEYRHFQALAVVALARQTWPTLEATHFLLAAAFTFNQPLILQAVLHPQPPQAELVRMAAFMEVVALAAVHLPTVSIAALAATVATATYA
jgi:hypothetical protein